MSALITAVIQIGNSDDKLSQFEWSEFCADLGHIADGSEEIHYMGGSPSNAPWQNACWVISISTAALPDLRANLAGMAKDYGQESIALTVGDTEFVRQ